MTPTERRNTAVIRRLYKGYNDRKATPEKRLAAVLAPLAEDARYFEHAPPEILAWGGAFKCRKGWQNFLVAISSELEHEDFSGDKIIASGSYVFAWGRIVTKCRKTGRRSSAAWQHRHKLRGGKIVECHEFYDTLRTALDLGRVRAT